MRQGRRLLANTDCVVGAGSNLDKARVAGVSALTEDEWFELVGER